LGLFEKIIIPTDGSEYARKAAELALDIAEREGASVVVVHVIPIVSPLSAKPKIRAPEEILEEAEEIVEEIVEMAKDRGIEDVKDVIVESTSVVEGIRKVAEDEDADLIVIGTRGLTGVKGVIVGSTAREILGRVDCPVLVVPPGD